MASDYKMGEELGKKMAEGNCSFTTIYNEARNHCDDAVMHLNVIQGWVREVMDYEFTVPADGEEQIKALNRLCDVLERRLPDVIRDPEG